MKRPFLFLLLLSLATGARSQGDNELIQEKVNLFFKALLTQDTVLYRSLVMPEGQIWVSRQPGDSVRQLRSFSDDMRSLVNPQKHFDERPLRFDINVRGNIAEAWVPYEFYLNGAFSHCGVDVFTFLRAADGWKIVSTVYSVEKEGCRH